MSASIPPHDVGRSSVHAPDSPNGHASHGGAAPQPGRVIFIGAGPGAADLITVRGARCLALADVVLFDALTDPALRALAPQARWVDVGKRGFAKATGQAAINAMLVRYAFQCRTVVRLKGGDPSIFGRLEEELQTLQQHGVACEVVPGVTAAIAAAAATQRPLTRRGAGRSVSLTTGMTREGELRGAHSADTEVFYMAGRQLAALGRRLLAAGWPADTPVNVVSRAGWPDQLASEHALASLGQAALLHSGRPTVVVVGAGAAPVVPGLAAPASAATAAALEALEALEVLDALAKPAPAAPRAAQAPPHRPPVRAAGETPLAAATSAAL